jgi:hypothetical protein
MAAVASDLWELIKEGQAAYAAGDEIITEGKKVVGSFGRKRTGSGSSKHFTRRNINHSDHGAPNSGETRAGTRYRPPREPSQSNLHRSINTGQHMPITGKRQGTDGDEVQVMPPPKKVPKIHPDYFTIQLPYVQRLSTSTEANFTYNTAAPFAIIRLNSIYDPLKETHSGAGNPLAEADLQPHGRHIWDTHFKFYRVLKTFVKLTFVTNRVVLTANSSRPWNEFYAIGYELIDEDAPVSDDVDMFLMTKHAKRDIMGPSRKLLSFDSAGASVNQLSAGTTSKSMTYVYTPEAWDYHVEEKGSEERWTKIGSNPAIDHDLAIRIMHLDKQTPTGQTGSVGCFIQITYEVQFREGTDSFLKTLNSDTATYPDADAGTD